MAFRRRTKSYPLFSQEFVIHNHADIGFCLVLCVLIGLMFEMRTPEIESWPAPRMVPQSHHDDIKLEGTVWGPLHVHSQHNNDSFLTLSPLPSTYPQSRSF
uniref:Translocation associated membrane protein 2 n=1 Tax=Suricata suricatta TaxID=37032 RepID=A0A673U1F1_SURSU